MKRKPPAFHRPIRIEADFRRDLYTLFERWFGPAARKGPDELAEAFRVMGDSSQLFLQQLERIAGAMVTAIARGNSRSWKEAAAKATRGAQIHAMLREELAGPTGVAFRGYVAQTAALVRTMPHAIAQEVAEYVAERKIEGERASTISRELKAKLPRMVAYRIDMNARTLVASTATALTRARAGRLQLPWYIWDTSGDARVRPSHRAMDLVLVNWNDPPAPEALIGVKSTLGHYHAGNCPNCRCDANVLCDLGQVRWPHKVYHSGRIQWMSKKAFWAISGMEA